MITDEVGIPIEITNDIDGSVIRIAAEHSQLKKDGTPYKSVSVATSKMRLRNANEWIDATRVKGKGFDVWLLSALEFNYDGTLNGIINILQRTGNSEIKFGEDVTAKGPFNETSDGYLEDANKTTWKVNSTSISYDTKEMDKFVTILFHRPQGLVAPLIGKFASVTRNIPTHSRKLTGYVSVDRWLRQIRKGNIIPKLGRNVDAQQDRIISINAGKLTLVPREVAGEVEFTIPNAEYVEPRDGGNLTPYLLISTAPLTVSGSPYPSKAIPIRGKTFFVMPIVLTDPSILDKMPGGVDLLK
jgi:hypothetical protein